ncbi:MAG: hypothetical protein K8I27_06760 [Planctomycetes bacterium]|nr:hypothetical protein [Planctomycetota bacterium]
MSGQNDDNPVGRVRRLLGLTHGEMGTGVLFVRPSAVKAWESGYSRSRPKALQLAFLASLADELEGLPSSARLQLATALMRSWSNSSELMQNEVGDDQAKMLELLQARQVSAVDGPLAYVETELRGHDMAHALKSVAEDTIGAVKYLLASAGLDSEFKVTSRYGNDSPDGMWVKCMTVDRIQKHWATGKVSREFSKGGHWLAMWILPQPGNTDNCFRYRCVFTQFAPKPVLTKLRGTRYLPEESLKEFSDCRAALRKNHKIELVWTPPDIYQPDLLFSVSPLAPAGTSWPAYAEIAVKVIVTLLQ